MSPMLDVQKRHAELFRVRLGERRVAANGKERPAALDGQIRITSPSAEVIEAVSDAYGGVTSAWNDQYQVYVDRSELPIVVLPGQSCQQWWEQWRHKVGGMPVCTHRCDGEMNYQTGEPCTCPPVEERTGDQACKPTTRLWVMLPEVRVMGAGRLETHGMVAAETLPQSVLVLQQALARGDLVPATLRIRRVESSGKSYVVPQVEVVGLSLAELSGAAARSPQLPAGEGVVPDLTTPSPISAPGPDPRATAPGAATTRELNALRKMMAARGITAEKDILTEVWELSGTRFEALAAIDADVVKGVLDRE